LFRDAPRHAALAAALALLSACTVKPLYDAPAVQPAAMPGDAATSMSMQATLSSVSISPAASRQGQQVRNRLIFLFGQGAGEPKQAAYKLDLNVSSTTIGVAAVPVAGVVYSGQPSAANVEMTASFTVTDSAGVVQFKGVRRATAAYDVPQQNFAERAALIDAEDRAARELAEAVHLAVAQGFATR
jgi:LPS-assembly lipoprotein